MKKVTLTFEISEESFELLKKLENRSAEYRDTEYNTLEDFKNSEEFKSGLRTEKWFLNRNFNGTYYLIDELLKYGLVEDDGLSWHPTYIISDFGKEILDNV